MDMNESSGGGTRVKTPIRVEISYGTGDVIRMKRRPKCDIV